MNSLEQLEENLDNSLATIHRVQAERAAKHSQPTAIKAFDPVRLIECGECGSPLNSDLYYDDARRAYCLACALQTASA
jgi:hypothetical protein